jgi:uncharacterized RDD family membrane protein YckC
LRKADLTSRAAAALVDLLIIIGLARLPDIIGFLAAAGYILIRDGLFDRRSIGKKLIGLQVVSSEGQGPALTYRESIIRNIPIVVAYFFFLIPYVGWALGPAVLGVECLTAIGDSAGMRIGDMLARTSVALALPVAADRPSDPGPSGTVSAGTKAT